MALRDEGDDSALVMELAASVRLFGGLVVLQDRIDREGQALGARASGWAPNASAAVCLARAGGGKATPSGLAGALDALPLPALAASRTHDPMLQRLGCRTLGDLRRLPRGGVARRFGSGLLLALDEAYGLVETAQRWVELPQTFSLRLEPAARLETADALGAAAWPMLQALRGWLAARQHGVLALQLAWLHDSMRAREAGPGGHLTVRTARATRDMQHLSRLLAEQLARTTLAAPVAGLWLTTLATEPLADPTAELLPSEGLTQEAFLRVSERVAARLGPGRLLRPELLQDWRAEWMQRWHPVGPDAPPGRAWATGPEAAPRLPQPTWLLDEPLALALRDERPLYQGELLVLIGPQRVDAGWWHVPQPPTRPPADPVATDHPTLPATGYRTTTPQSARPDGGAEVPKPGAAKSCAGARAHHQSRDYWIALSRTAGVLWIYRDLLDRTQPRWYLHGVFA